MNFDLFLGCVIAARLPFLEASGRKMFSKLGVELNNVEDFSCCPDPTGLEVVSQKAWVALGARNLSLSKADDGIVSFCSGCVKTLKCANHEVNTHDKKEINEILGKIGKSYDGSTQVRHFAQVLYEQLKKVKKATTKPLKGFKIAVQYGCHYLRPSRIVKWDDPINPKSIDKILEALGAETIPYDLKMDCCGYGVRKTDEDLSLLVINNKLESIKKTEANCIVVACPACFQQFDFNQRDLSKRNGTDFSYPIFYLTEIVALAFGFSYNELGLKFHHTKVKKFLQSMNFSD